MDDDSDSDEESDEETPAKKVMKLRWYYVLLCLVT